MIEEHLKKYENKEEARKIKAYARNKFEYFGLRAPVMKEAFKQFVRENGVWDMNDELLKELYKREYREVQMFALYLMDQKKEWRENDIQLLECAISTKSWWDTVDHLAIQHLGKYMKQCPEKRDEITDRWLNRGNIWLIRSLILFQNKYKKETDAEYLFRLILSIKPTNEFFINKAIGWALRE